MVSASWVSKSGPKNKILPMLASTHSSTTCLKTLKGAQKIAKSAGSGIFPTLLYAGIPNIEECLELTGYNEPGKLCRVKFSMIILPALPSLSDAPMTAMLRGSNNCSNFCLIRVYIFQNGFKKPKTLCKFIS